MRGSNKDVSENEKLFLELTENEKRLRSNQENEMLFERQSYGLFPERLHAPSGHAVSVIPIRLY